jgi:polyhydroxybutyrate depolymerase
MKYITLIITLFYLSSCKKIEDTSPINSPDKGSEQKTIKLTIDGTVRNFVVYNPKGYNNAGKMPLIFALHGGSGSPDAMLKLADFRAIADRDKVVIVYPAGIETSWNDGRPTNANVLGINDVSFINQLCDYMVANYSVDSKKIYATGISNGGFMSSRLGCELSNRIAAIAVDAATFEQNKIFPNCSPTNSLPAMYIHGTLDLLVPFNGGTVAASGSNGAGGLVVSHAQAVAKWVTLNKCNATPITTDLPDITNDGTTIKERRYTNGTNGSEVVSYVITNGGHTWPQGYQYLSEAIIGKTSQDMNACEVIWAFFKRFSR